MLKHVVEAEESYVGRQSKAYQGYLLAIVCSTGQIGEITLTAQAEGLPPAQVKIQSK
jgi:hypothetical protein